MSMTREEAIVVLAESKRQNEVMRDNPSTFLASHQMADGVKNAERRIAALDIALSALRPVSREQVENVWKGKWEPGNPICPICGKDKFDGLDADIWADWMPNFCPHCGAPMTDKAVEIVMERMEALYVQEEAD